MIIKLVKTSEKEKERINILRAIIGVEFIFYWFAFGINGNFIR